MRASKRTCPAHSKCFVVKCFPFSSPVSAPRKLASIVKTLGIFSSLKTEIQAVASLALE
jgi:hypothetical protein